jgi:pyridoxal phosphate enzyme (YggS family)
VHGVDSLKLLQEIDKQAQKHNRTIDCLLQMHIAEEETKFGMDEKELNDLLHSNEYNSLKNIQIKGLMGMATFTENEAQIRKEFMYLKSVYDQIKDHNPQFEILSMGMSGDYKVAIDCGSTMVRIGSSIFGGR